MSEAAKEFVNQLMGRKQWLLKELEENDKSLKIALGMVNGKVAAVKEDEPADQQVRIKQPKKKRRRHGPYGKIGKTRSRIREEADALRAKILALMAPRRTWLPKHGIHQLVERNAASHLEGTRNRYARVSDAVNVLVGEGKILRKGDFYGLESFVEFESEVNKTAMRGWRNELRKRKSASMVAYNSRAKGEGEVAE